MTSPSLLVVTERQADYQNTDRSTAQTVQEMIGHIRSAVQDPEVRRIASGAAAQGRNDSRREIADSIWRWCKANVQFVPDEVQLENLMGRRDELELLISPSVMIRPQLLGSDTMQGDCDCFTMLACSMLACCGVPPVIWTFKCDASDPSRWSHVCAAAVLENGKVYPVDASHGTYPGWRVPARDVFDSALWDMKGNRINSGMSGYSRLRSRGLSGYVPDPNWTGNEMTTVRGRHAGPYPGGDVMRYYYPGSGSNSSRGAALRQMARGMGECLEYNADGSCAYDDNTGGPTPLAGGGIISTLPNYNTITGDSGPLSNPVTLPSSPVASSSSPGINWGSILGQLISGGAKVGTVAVAPAGSVITPTGAVITPGSQSIFGTAGVINSNFLMIGALLLGVVLIASAAKK